MSNRKEKNSMINVAFISKHLSKQPIDGVAVYDDNILYALKELAINVYGIWPAKGICGTWPFYNLMSFRRVTNLAEQKRINIIHGTMGDSVLSSRIRTLPFILSTHGTLAAEIDRNESYSRDLSEKRFDRFIIRKSIVAAERISANNADIVISPSEYAKQKSVEYYSIPPKKVIVVPHGINIKKFYNPAKCYEPKKNSSTKLQLLFVGKLRHIKGVIYLIKAANILSNRYPLELRIVGDGPERPFLEAYCRSQNLNFAHFIGDIPNKLIVNEYMNCDIFCLPSLHEGFGIVLLEAMAAKKPVVATNVGGIPEVVKNNQTGLLVPPGDENRLADAIEALIIDRELRLRMGTQGYKVVQSYTWEKAAQKIVQVYKSLI